MVTKADAKPVPIMYSEKGIPHEYLLYPDEGDILVHRARMSRAERTT